MKDYLILLAAEEEDDPTGIDDMISWTQEHVALLSSTTMLVSTTAIAERLRNEVDVLAGTKDENGLFNNHNDERKDNNTTILSWELEVEILLGDDNDEDFILDLIVVHKIMSLSSERANHVVGVFFFPGSSQRKCLSSSSVPSSSPLNNIIRVCQHLQPNIPLALNRSTATLCIRSLFHTRIAYVVFNPSAGQRPAAEDLVILKQMLEPSMRLKICCTEKERSIAEQTYEIVSLIKQQQQQIEMYQRLLFKGAGGVRTPGGTSTYDPNYKFMIIASGGDGTVSAVAGATMKSGITVGIIPRGTANAFSVALGIPVTSVEEACTNILKGIVREVDGALLTPDSIWHSSLVEDEGEGDQKLYPENPLHNETIQWINHAGLGFEAGLVDNATRELKDKFGNLAYTIGAAQQVMRNEVFRCTFVVDGDESTEKTVETNIITIANVDAPSSIWAQGFGQVIPDDGFFEVTIGTATGLNEIRQLATLAANALVKDSLGSDTLLCLRCKEIKVTCDPPQKLLLDGEVIKDMDTVTFTCVPKGLKVIAPPVENEEVF